MGVINVVIKVLCATRKYPRGMDLRVHQRRITKEVKFKPNLSQPIEVSQVMRV